MFPLKCRSSVEQCALDKYIVDQNIVKMPSSVYLEDYLEWLIYKVWRKWPKYLYLVVFWVRILTEYLRIERYRVNFLQFFMLLYSDNNLELRVSRRCLKSVFNFSLSLFLKRNTFTRFDNKKSKSENWKLFIYDSTPGLITRTNAWMTSYIQTDTKTNENNNNFAICKWIQSVIKYFKWYM